MDYQELLYQARRRVLTDADEAREVMHSELNQVMSSAFKEKLQTIIAAANLHTLANPHFDPTDVLEKYIITSSLDNSIPPAMYVHLKNLLPDHKQLPDQVPSKYESPSDKHIDLSCLSASKSSSSSSLSSSSSSSSSSSFSSSSSSSAFLSPPQKRKYSMSDLDSSAPTINSTKASKVSKAKEISVDETLNNFAKENRKENVITLQQKCLLDSCNLHFESKNAVHAHMAQVHSVLKFSCHVLNCGVSFRKQHQLTNHLLKDHSSMSVFSCFKCGKAFKKYSLMSHHIHIEHAEGLFQCAVEGCTFQGCIRSQITRHFERNHRKYRCSHCERTFTYTGHLRTHERSHLHVKPYSCTWPNCTYVTDNKSHIICHIRTMHFNLPSSKKRQASLNIEDDRNPTDYVATDYEQIEQTKNLFKIENPNSVFIREKAEEV